MTTKKAIQRKTAPIASKLVRLHDGSREFGLLLSCHQEEDCQIARIGERNVVLPLSADLSEFIGQPIVLMMNREQCLVRLQGYDIHGVPA
jgi:hypothetical protein